MSMDPGSLGSITRRFPWTSALVGAAGISALGPLLPYLAAPTTGPVFRWDGSVFLKVLLGVALTAVAVIAHMLPERQRPFAAAALGLGALGLLLFLVLPGSGFVFVGLGTLARMGDVGMYFITWEVGVLLTVLGHLGSAVCAAVVLRAGHPVEPASSGPRT